MPSSRRSGPPRALLALALVALAGCASALYEEEAGTFDWTRRQVGQPERALFSPPSAAGKPAKTAFVGTAAGVVAALRTRSGDIAWRQVLPEGERVAALALRASPKKAKAVATASAACAAVRVWDAATGALQWEDVAAAPEGEAGVAHLSSALRHARSAGAAPAGAAAPDACFAAFVEGGARLVTASRAGRVTLRDAATGRVRWAADAGAADVAGLVPLEDDAFVGVLSASRGLVLLRAASGDEARAWPLAAASGGAAPAVTWNGLVAGLVDGGRSLAVADASRATASAAPAEETHALKGGAAARVRSLTAPGSCASRPGGAAAFVAVGTAGAAGTERVLELRGAAAAPVARGAAAAAVGAHCSGDVASAAAGEGGRPAAVWVAGAASRALVAGADHALRAVDAAGKQLWAREEALASVEASAFLEAPPAGPFDGGDGAAAGAAGAGDDGDDEPEFPPVWRRLGVQARMLAAMARQGVAAALAAARGEAAARDAEYDELFAAAADPFGFHKRVLAVTAPGRVFALSTLSGDAEWSLQLRTAAGAPLSDEHRAGARWRYEVRVTGLLHAVVVAAPPAGAAGTVRAWNINTRTGAVSGAPVEYAAAGGLAAVQRLPLLDAAHHSPLVLLGGDLDVRVFPDTAEARALVGAHAARVFFHVTDADGAAVRGVRLAGGEGGAPLRALETWAVAFPRGVERVSAVACARDEPVQSSLRRVRGGTEALHKWLNPHLVAVATVRGAAALRPVPSVKKVTDPSVNVYLVDGVTGAVVDRVTHRGGEGPVEAVVSENVVYYHFFDAKAMRFELSVLELFHDEARGDPSALAGDDFSSFTVASPRSVQRTYHLEGGANARALAVTRTRRGIADKSLLLGLGSGQVALLPRRLLDARRPMTHEVSAQDKADGLLPYKATMPLQREGFVSYTQEVARVRDVSTHHALLESTSLVFARGLDLFFTRVTPSAGFDLLSEDFNAPFLLLTVTGIMVATAVTRRLASRKALSLAWA